MNEDKNNINEEELDNYLTEVNPEQEKKEKKSKIGWSLFFSIMIILMIICVIVIKYLSK